MEIYMRILAVLIGALFLLETSKAAEYQPDWNFNKFYSFVKSCEAAVVLPAAAEYERRASSNNLNAEAARRELIGLAPVIGGAASDYCYCVADKIAQERSYGSTQNVPGLLESYAKTPACAAKVEALGNNLNSQRGIEAGGENCLREGPVTLTGLIVSQTFTLEPDGRKSTMYFLNLREPVCVLYDPLEPGPVIKDTVDRFQLINYEAAALKENLFKEVTVVGSYTANNVTQYYREPNAISVDSLR
jgi:hypothetical protein